jgi:hypothetical protein
MSGKLSPSANARLATIGEFINRVQRVHGLVEMYATAKGNADQYLMPMQRGFGQLKMMFMGAGLDSLSQLCGAMEIAAKRGMSPMQKIRILRDGVGSLKFQLELEQRAVVSEDQARQARESRAEETG